jgi:hypothetical protein
MAATTNVFVLTTGRSGSLTFTRACERITNYTAGHETRSGLLGRERLAYPDRHIEVDNRLAWMLGRLEDAHGDRAFYVHLRRDEEATAESHVGREAGAAVSRPAAARTGRDTRTAAGEHARPRRPRAAPLPARGLTEAVQPPGRTGQRPRNSDCAATSRYACSARRGLPMRQSGWPTVRRSAFRYTMARTCGSLRYTCR